MLLPVTLLAGLAKKLFGPLALTVATAMFAGYFVSMLVTPLACRTFLKDSQPGRLAEAVRATIGRIADGYSGALRAVLPYRWLVPAACLVMVGASIWMVTRLPSTFFPEIDESMERVYVRVAPGTSLQDAAKKINGMGALLAKELPPGTTDLVLTNVGSPGNARSAMTSPNNGPHMGFIRVALSDAEHRKQSQREIADKMREILNKHYPGVEFLQWPGGLVASVFSNGYLAPLVVEVEADSLEELDTKSKAIAEVARGRPRHPRHLPVHSARLSRTARRDRPHAGGAGRRVARATPPRRHSKRRSGTSTRPASGSTVPTASRITWSRPTMAASSTIRTPCRGSRCASARTAAP